MAKPKTRNIPYSEKEKQYIRRAAGKVPAAVIAETLKRSQSGIKQWASAHGVHLRVPYAIMMKHWRDYARSYEKAV